MRVIDGARVASGLVEDPKHEGIDAKQDGATPVGLLSAARTFGSPIRSSPRSVTEPHHRPGCRLGIPLAS